VEASDLLKLIERPCQHARSPCHGEVELDIIAGVVPAAADVPPIGRAIRDVLTRSGVKEHIQKWVKIKEVLSNGAAFGPATGLGVDAPQHKSGRSSGMAPTESLRQGMRLLGPSLPLRCAS
jgi:hypothetical protein